METGTLPVSRLSAWNPLRMLTRRLRTRLLLGFLAVAAIPLLLLGGTLYLQAKRSNLEQSAAQMSRLRDWQAAALERHFRNTGRQAVALAQSPLVGQALGHFRQSFQTAREENNLTAEQLGEMRRQLLARLAKQSESLSPADREQQEKLVQSLDDKAILLQFLYQDFDQKSMGDETSETPWKDISTYREHHAAYDSMLKSISDKTGFVNLQLVDGESGDIVYATRTQLDSGASLKTGPFADSHAAQAYRLALAAEGAEPVIFLDYADYAAAGEPVAILAAPVSRQGETVGVALFHLSVQSVEELLVQQAGATVRFRLIGPDHQPRGMAAGAGELRTPASEAALRGESGSGVVQGETATQSVWGPVAVWTAPAGQGKSVTWALLAERNLADVQAPLRSLIGVGATMIGVALLIVVWLSWLCSHKVIAQVEAISQMLGQLGIGDFDARAEVITEDELGTVAASLNAICDNTLTLIQTREERDRITAAVTRLKDEVATVAAGDLTVEARVSGQITGDIADSVNFMVGQLRGIIRNVQDATVRVSSSANEIQTTTEQLSIGSQTQSAQILETSQAIREMARSIQQVSGNTRQSAEVANQARDSARRGHQAVRNTIEGMERIREQVRDSSKRIKRLGETSQEVGEIVQLISDIADRTSILALNASIQAAMAGEAGHGFAVVAEEVERLAERCNGATRQIASLIQAIQSDTGEVIAAMEESTREVVEGSSLAVEAGRMLDEIDQVSTDLAALINQISQATELQAHGADAVSRSMSQIAQVTQETARGTKEAAESSSELSHLAESLFDSVSAFKLPSRGGSEYVFEIDPDTPNSQVTYSGILRRKRSNLPMYPNEFEE